MSTNKELRNRIHNIEDLMNEIARIDALKHEQEIHLVAHYRFIKEKIEAPVRFANRMFSNVPGVGAVRGVLSAMKKTDKKSDKSDWLTKSLQLITPLVLNRTILKNSGWLKKAAVTIASETAVSQVNQSSVSTVFSGLANFIRPKKRRLKSVQAAGEITAEEAVESNKYGIPKDSETY